ncbi:hypothetical protein [Haloplanus halobius]|uniref:hypothetical protein n=1 Tax=Haloplanus halobius TaxID=2934938 RepID=UPI00200C00E3|nr:hypothetical protein [Haloplanus sp. XH21]
MSQLRSCYFCGAVGDSLQEYAIPGVAPAESRSAVLCSTCHEKLRRVLEPFAGSDAPDRPAVSASGSSLQEVTFDSSGDRDDGVVADENGVGADAEADTADDVSTGDADGPDDGASVVNAAPDVDGSNSDAEEAAAEPSANEGSSADADDADVPEEYYKVLRLLQNREFPMERADLTSLVTAAYDVSPSQCDRILETAVERGVLVEDGSTFDLGRH